jgi:hypothetical protein
MTEEPEIIDRVKASHAMPTMEDLTFS